jgi:hypothetical protein
MVLQHPPNLTGTLSPCLTRQMMKHQRAQNGIEIRVGRGNASRLDRDYVMKLERLRGGGQLVRVVQVALARQRVQ